MARLKLKQKIGKLIKGSANQTDADKGVIIGTGIIIIFGLIMLSSASSVIAYNEYQDSYFFFKRQLVGLFFGLIAFLVLSRIDYHRWRKYAFPLLIFSIVLLLLVFIPGLQATYGTARSWINIFGQSLQPSEFVKLSFLLYLAAWLESRHKKLEDVSQGIGPFVAVLGIISLLLLLQPDIGTLSIIALTSVIVYFVGGGGIKHLLAMMIIAVLGFAALVQLKPYQMNRFKCLLEPQFSSADICYQVNQSLIAIGSGGIWGRGLGASRQKYLYLPEVQGDSIFSVIGEETGLLVSSLLLLLFSFLFYRGYKVSKQAPDRFGGLLAIGIVSWIAIQALVNIGGMVNLVPVTGVPLPLISYGGSSMLATLAALGILVNISKQARIK